jgi:hypothetical protein
MLKHVLAAGTLAASSLILGMTMSAQPAGASAITQEATAATGLLNGGYTSHDPYDPTYPNPWGGGFLHHNAYGPGYHYHPGAWGGYNYGYFGHISHR